MLSSRCLPLLMALYSVPAVAQADAPKEDTKAKAKALFEAGERHFRLGDFARAAEEFRLSYEASPAPVPLLLFNIAQAYRALGDDEKALFFYKQYNSSTALSADQKRNVEERIAQLQRAIDEHKKAQEAPPTGPVVTQSDAQSKANNSSTDTAARLEIASPPPARPRPWYKSTKGWAFGGSGLVLVAVAGALLGLSEAEHNSAISAATQVDFDLHHGNDLRYQQAGWPLLGVGISAVAAGGLYFALDARRSAGGH